MSEQGDGIDAYLKAGLVCPGDRLPLDFSAGSLRCGRGHTYRVIDGIPVMLPQEVEPTFPMFRNIPAESGSGADPLFLETVGLPREHRDAVMRRYREASWPIDPLVPYLVASTNGNAYKHLVGSLREYPIPEVRLAPGDGRRLLDIGCNWGRWSIAAAREGYAVVGIDPCLGAVAAARRVARQMGVECLYLVGDARHLPFRDGSFDQVFSYSVLQHLSREDVAQVVAEIGRVLDASGASLVQMPTRYGVRCLYQQARRGFREGSGFDVRYWTLPSLRRLFQSAIGETSFSVDCFFGIGLQYSDRQLMRPLVRAAVVVSEWLRRLASRLPILNIAADSVWVASSKA